MKITVLGAGTIGTAVAVDLARSGEASHVQVCEAHPSTLRAFRAAHAHPGLRTYEADARDAQALEPIVSGSVCVVSCVGPEHSARLARLALDLGAHFVDLGNPLADDGLTELAERRQRWVVTGCGLAPGLVGVLAMRGVDAMDEARAVRIRVGDVPLTPPEPFRHRLAHSAERLLDDYTQPAPVLVNGQIETREPLTGLEPVEVDGFGTMEAFYTGAGLGSLAQALEGRVGSLDVKTIRYPGHAERMRFVLDLGLADRTSLDVRTHLTYRDVLVRRLRKRLGGAYDDAVLLRIEVDGVRDGDEGTRVYEMVDRCDTEGGLSAMQRCTGFPASVAALLLAGRALPGGGVGPADQVLPAEPFLERLAARGIAAQERWVPAVAV
ncbi:saccharopine dehydrogenase C-terminal domain-containing protein [Rubrivirga sp.]|uniref:saccharopine dehydrogenase family protein n=1 Tax=Rubrivirga sp. TaxID=1885344 RepID=UPI003B51E3EF